MWGVPWKDTPRRPDNDAVNGFASDAAIMVFGDDLRIVCWNDGAEKLTGIPAAEAVGRPCWQVVAGHDDRGDLTCHQACSRARLVREGRTVGSALIHARTPTGRRRLSFETVTAHRTPCHSSESAWLWGSDSAIRAIPATRCGPRCGPREIVRTWRVNVCRHLVACRVGRSPSAISRSCLIDPVPSGCVGSIHTVGIPLRRGLAPHRAIGADELPGLRQHAR
jgi:PAS domain S-box-containing protein